MRPVLATFAFVLALAPSLAGAQQANVTSVNVDLENWMARLPGVADLPLTKLPIPGTHDSGSYAIKSSSPWALTGKDDFGKLSKVPGFLVKPTAAAWSRTQPKAILFQLADGIRYVDLRLSHEPDGKISIEHGLRGSDVDEILRDIALFAIAHPKEVVFVDFARFTNFTKASHELLVKKIRAALGTRLVPDSAGTSTTLRQLWALDKNVIALYDEASVADDAANPDLWNESTIFSPWANVDTTDKLFEATKKDLAQRDPARIWGLTGTVTPTGGMIAKGIFELGPDSIEELMREKVHQDVQRWIRKDFAASLNLVTTDWYDAPWEGGSCFVRDVLSAVDGAHPPVPWGVKKTGSGSFWSWKNVFVRTWAEFAWEPVAGATGYEIQLDAVSKLRNSTSQKSDKPSIRLERSNAPWADPIVKGAKYDVRVRAKVNGAWQAWSKARRIDL